MRIVFINSIYPNPVEPAKGNFVKKNLMHYPPDIKLEVIAPVPFFLALRRGKKQAVPLVRKEDLGGRFIRVWHPRFPLLPRNILRPLVPFFEYLSILPILWLIHWSRGIDTLHANFCMPDGVATYKLAHRFRIPYIITEHQAALAEYLQDATLKRQMLPAYLAAHKVIAVSEHTKGILAGAKVPEAKLKVIPNGIDTSLFVPSASAGTIKKLIYIGYLVEHKGVQVLLQALALLKGFDLTLTIVGDGSYRGELECLRDKLCLQDRVSFLGEKNAGKVAELLREHDALVHPSFIESFGITVVEALATGIPVVATINGGSEHILSPQTGILVVPRDAQALAEGIRELISRKWDRQVIRDYAIENYDIKNVVQETIAQYPAPQARVCQLSSVHIRSDVRVFYKQCVSLEKAGYKVHLVVADSKGNELKNGVRIHDIGKAKGRLQRMLSAPLKLFFKALALRANIYQIHDPELIPLAIALKLFTRKPVIYDIHECYPEMFLHKEYLKPWQGKLLSLGIRLLEKLAISILDRGIAATEHIAGQFKDVFILHNYPLLSEWQSVPESPERHNKSDICYLGNITRERGITQLIRALEYVDCTLHLAGGYEPPSYREELINLPGFSKVKEYGYINRAQAAELLGSCALGVVLFDKSPNHLYSLSTKMFEYMAAGLPILVSDLPANMKLLDSAACGRYIDPSEPQEIAKAIKELLNDPAALAEMGAKGKELINTRLSWEAEMPAFLELYYSLINKEPK